MDFVVAHSHLKHPGDHQCRFRGLQCMELQDDGAVLDQVGELSDVSDHPVHWDGSLVRLHRLLVRWIPTVEREGSVLVQHAMFDRGQEDLVLWLTLAELVQALLQ